MPEPLWRSRHRAMVLLLLAHAVVLPGWSLLWGHPVEHAVSGSAVLVVLALFGAVCRSRLLASGAVSAGLVVASALVVHLGNGHTFLHFHFFVVVAAMALYQDWAPFGIALVLVLVDHGLMASLSAHSVYDDPWSRAHPAAATAIHGSYVLAAATASVVNWGWSQRERSAAEARAESESARLRDSERRVNELIDNSPSQVFVKDLDGRLTRVNPQFAAMHRRTAEQLIGMRASDLMGNSEESTASDLAVLSTAQPVEFEFEVDLPDGLRTMHIVKFPLLDADGTPYAIACKAMDITRRADAERALLWQNRHDDLTGLPNRRHLMASAAEALTQEHLVGLAFVDLDGFKEVNDSLGHEIGDALLQAVAGRLGSVCEADEVLFRLGGDEFVLLTPMLTTPENATDSAHRLLAALAAPLTVAGRSIEVSGSCGVAVGCGADGTTVSTLLRDADTALYEAKATCPGGIVGFSSFLRERDERRRHLQADLAEALRDGAGLRLDYQPVIESDGGQTVLVEGLIRWEHPTEGPMSPADFLPAAAQAGLLPALDRWVIGRACEQAKEWRDAGLHLAIAVNVTPETVSTGEVVGWFRDSCAATGTSPTQLVMELTETAAIDHPEATSQVLSELRLMGIRIALDDFGTGYSSLSLLRDLPVDIVKIDRKFVSGLTASSDDVAIVRATNDLAHALGLTTIAEGVETPQDVLAATAIGCDLLQGWQIARALAPADLVRHLASVIPLPRGAAEQRRRAAI